MDINDNMVGMENNESKDNVNPSDRLILSRKENWKANGSED